MELCNCLETKSTHSVDHIGSWGGCPLVGGGHTSFAVHRCKECGKICFFPDDNGKIALEKGTPETKKKLEEIIAENETAPVVLIEGLPDETIEFEG